MEKLNLSFALCVLVALFISLKPPDPSLYLTLQVSSMSDAYVNSYGLPPDVTESYLSQNSLLVS